MSLTALTSDHQQEGVFIESPLTHFEIIWSLEATTLLGLLALISSKTGLGILRWIPTECHSATMPPVIAMWEIISLSLRGNS